jgi:3-deoxy-D-arabino-heptulosonate 7-phosphate (DAHP) synthase
MFRPTDDLRITEVRPLIPPAILLEELPITERASNVVSNARAAAADALGGGDPRLVVIAGPCSIHDAAAALDYAGELKQMADRYGGHLIVIMRGYFEKPRTSIGWKGFINDRSRSSCPPPIARAGFGIVFSRSAAEVLNIVYLGGASANFGFFPNRLNGSIA